MSEKAKRVLAVWVSLTPKEREEAINLINEYQNADENKRHEISLEALNESRLVLKSTTMNFGPLGSGCLYCGK